MNEEIPAEAIAEAASPGHRDLQAEQGYAEFTGWWTAQGWPDGQPRDFTDVREAFAAGMQAQRDLPPMPASSASVKDESVLTCLTEALRRLPRVEVLPEHAGLTGATCSAGRLTNPAGVARILFDALREELGQRSLDGRDEPAPDATPATADDDARNAALRADRDQLRDCLHRIALGIAGEPSTAADQALSASRTLAASGCLVCAEVGGPHAGPQPAPSRAELETAMALALQNLIDEDAARQPQPAPETPGTAARSDLLLLLGELWRTSTAERSAVDGILRAADVYAAAASAQPDPELADAAAKSDRLEGQAEDLRGQLAVRKSLTGFVDVHFIGNGPHPLQLVCLTEDASDVECGQEIGEVEPGANWGELEALISAHAVECHGATTLAMPGAVTREGQPS